MSFHVKYFWHTLVACVQAAVVEFVSYSLSELRFRELFSLATNIFNDWNLVCHVTSQELISFHENMLFKLIQTH